jgi:hypothetical protein
MVIQRKLLHTCNYTLYTVYNLQDLWFRLNMGTYLFKNQYLSKTYQDIGNQLYGK